MTQIPDLGTITVREIRDGLFTGIFTAEALTEAALAHVKACLLYTSPSPRD